MIRKFVVFAVLTLWMNKQTDAQFSLSGTVKGYKEGTLKMIGVSGDQNYILDSAVISNDYFTLKRSQKIQEGFYYLILPDSRNLQLLVDANQKISFTTIKEKPIQQMQFDAHVSNNLLYDGLRIQATLDSIQQVLKSGIEGALREEMEDMLNTFIIKRNAHLEYCKANYPEEFYTIFKSAGQNPQISEFRKKDGNIDTLRQLAQYRLDFWSNVNLGDERLLYTPVLANKLRRFITELTPQNPDSIIKQADFIIKKSMVNDQVFQFFTNWIALQYQPTKTSVMDGEAVYVHIIDTYFNEKTSHWFKSGELDRLKKRAGEMRPSLLGKKGPDVISTDPSGKQKSIYELKAPYIIVYMYAPHCEHCMKETPKLKKFADEWKNKGVDVFAIALETNPEEWKGYIQKNQMQSWVNVHDPSNRSIYAKYYVDITPEIYVLNPDRIIIGKNLKTDQIATIIERDKIKRSKK
jgi:thiol-disulfide isomerase/thioredoxin